MKVTTFAYLSLLPTTTIDAFVPVITLGAQSIQEKLARTTLELYGAKKVSALTKGVDTVFTSEQIDEFLPHRYPFALVDKVIEYEAGKKAVGVKCVTKVRWSSLSFMSLQT